MISVAMATFNGEKYIEKQLFSIYMQTRQPDEVVICDDCSTDRTLYIIEAFINKYKPEHWVLVKNKKNCGYVRNFFNALAITNGEIIFLSDQDDIWNENKIETMTTIMENKKEIALMTSELRYIDSQGNHLPYRHIHESHIIPNLRPKPLVYPLKVRRFCVTGGYQGMTMAIKREVVSIFLSLDPAIITCHDRMFGFIASTVKGMFVCNQILNDYRIHENNVIGMNMKSRRTLEDRICTLKEIESDYRSFLSALSLIPLDPRKGKKIARYLEKMIQTTSTRWRLMQSGQIIKTLAMIRKIYYFPSIKAYLGDVVYTFRDSVKNGI